MLAKVSQRINCARKYGPAHRIYQDMLPLTIMNMPHFGSLCKLLSHSSSLLVFFEHSYSPVRIKTQSKSIRLSQLCGKTNIRKGTKSGKCEEESIRFWYHEACQDYGYEGTEVDWFYLIGWRGRR